MPEQVEVQFNAAATAILKGVAASAASVAASSAKSAATLASIESVLGSISISLTSIASSSAAEAVAETGIETVLGAISTTIATPPLPVAVSIRLALPTIVKEGKVMPNFELANDEVATIPILVDDVAGNPVAPPAGDTFSVTSSSASLGAVIGPDGKSVILTPMVQQSPGLTVVVSDSAGLSSFTQIVDIVADTTPKAIILDIASATETPQPVPNAPGP